MRLAEQRAARWTRHQWPGQASEEDPRQRAGVGSDPQPDLSLPCVPRTTAFPGAHEPPPLQYSELATPHGCGAGRRAHHGRGLPTRTMSSSLGDREGDTDSLQSSNRHRVSVSLGDLGVARRMAPQGSR